jgi:hypothetical protein
MIFISKKCHSNTAYTYMYYIYMVKVAKKYQNVSKITLMIKRIYYLKRKVTHRLYFDCNDE